MGRVTQINISQGGVPKTPISEAVVTMNGIVGDRQADLRYHGGPNRAVCLWSYEVIEQLQQEGHPLEAGSAGENITLTGVNWDQLIPGTRLQIGRSLTLEITDYAPPCRTITHCFSDRRYHRINQEKYPGQSRLYARVLVEGTIYPNDSVQPLVDAEIS
ncbi:MAG: MOSC domain-containing protein [Elainellaceae cyanobacterium]